MFEHRLLLIITSSSVGDIIHSDTMRGVGVYTIQDDDYLILPYY
jgi:hypothetical protein